MISLRFAVSAPLVMRAGDHYRGRAADCLALAECAEDVDARTLFLAVAESFEHIAREADAIGCGALLN